MSRRRVAQRVPAPGLDVTEFPSDHAPSSLFRAHSRRRGAWHYSDGGEGRFDLAPPRGTCYAAETLAAAIRERLGESFVGQRRVPAAIADEMVVTELRPNAEVRAAAVEARGAEDYGITGELTTMGDYGVPQAWAALFAVAGFDGVHYRGRFSHTAGVTCWALFGAAGPGDEAVGESIDGREACAEAGILVLSAPPTDATTLRVVQPPSD